jgi:DNA-binding beta-propeller fold protein YncE
MNPVSCLKHIALGLVVAVASVACSDGDGSHRPSLASISVTPANPSIPMGLSQQFTATGTYSNGNVQDLNGSVVWASSKTDVATISSSGVAQSVTVGDTTVTASSGTVTGSTILTVTPPTLVSITVTPVNPEIALGDSQPFTATGTLTDGSAQDLTKTATWSSSDANVLLLNNSTGRNGVANTRGPGPVTVSATSGSIAGATAASVVRRTPQFLYATNMGSSDISAFSVDPATGTLSPIPGSPFATTNGATSIAVSRNFKFAYTADFASSQISAFSINSDGSLTPVPGTPYAAGNGALSLAAHPKADYLYVSAQGGEVMIFAIDPATGALHGKGSIDIGNAPQYSAMTSDGTRFYQTVSATAQIAGFSVSAGDGALTPVPDSPVSTGFFPRTIAVDPAGKFLYVTISSSFAGPSNSVFAYSIDALTGALTGVPGSPFTTGENPVSAAVDATGRFLFVANNANTASGNSVSVFSIDYETGALAAVPDAPFGTAPFPLFVAVDPSGQYVYVGMDGGISGFVLNQATGSLTPIAGASYPAASVWSIVLTY